VQNEEWMKSGLLWWRGEPIERHSERYQAFLQSVYDSLFAQSSAFRNALVATRGRVMTHRIGMRDASRTVLTEREFIRNLSRLHSKTLDWI
jgi:Bacteriophage protein GP30.3